MDEEALAMMKPPVVAERTNDPEYGRGELLPLENPPECLVRLWENQEVWTEERVQELERQQEETLRTRDGSRMRKYQLPSDEPRTDVYERLWESQEKWTEKSLLWLEKQRARKARMKELQSQRGFGADGDFGDDDSTHVGDDSPYYYDSVYSELSRPQSARDMRDLNRTLEKELHSVDSQFRTPKKKKGGLYGSDRNARSASPASRQQPGTGQLSELNEDLETRKANR